MELNKYLGPKEPTFLGLVMMSSFYKSLKNGRLFGVKVGKWGALVGG